MKKIYKIHKLSTKVLIATNVNVSYLKAIVRKNALSLGEKTLMAKKQAQYYNSIYKKNNYKKANFI